MPTNLFEDSINSVLSDFGIAQDDVFTTYIKAFIESNPNEYEWDDVYEQIVANYPMINAQALFADLKSIVHTFNTFRSIQNERKNHVVNVKTYVVDDTPCQEIIKEHEYKIDPDIKKRVVEEYFVRPVSNVANSVPVLSHIEYLKQTKGNVKQKRYRNDCVVTEKGDKFV